MPANESAPAAPVVPMLVYADIVSAIDWLCGAFGFQEHLRAERDGVVGHAQLKAEGGDLMLTRAGGPLTAPTSDHVHHCVCVTVADADAHYERSRAFGAVIVQ